MAEGRGFAVVADEVKKLADSTTVSTKKIADILEEIIGVSANAVAVMEQGKKDAEAGEELSGKTGDSRVGCAHQYVIVRGVSPEDLPSFSLIVTCLVCFL